MSKGVKNNIISILINGFEHILKAIHFLKGRLTERCVTQHLKANASRPTAIIPNVRPI